ncbi:MAG: hypothetical protein IIA62_06280 [Nitrospinae bacterium]|nr:hypothetical protein [Nitrospinota bacterium]
MTRHQPFPGMNLIQSLKMKLKIIIFILPVLPAIFSLWGCSGMGPVVLEQSRNNYNIAIQKTNDEQLLLNLVRLKYRDTPFFMEVSSVATQFTFSASANASATLPEHSPNIFGLGAGAAMTERPTISYSPLQGEKFIQRFLSPISLKTISLLFHSGWRVDRIFRVCFQHINRIKNAPTASGPTPEFAPEYEDFAHIAGLLQNLKSRGGLEAEYGIHENSPVFILHISEEALEWPETGKLMKFFNLPLGTNRLVLSGHSKDKPPGFLRVETRSLLGAMFYLSQSIEVPLKDQEMGKVTQTKDRSGKLFDWKKVTGDLIRVRSNSGFYDQSAVAVKYPGSWFYIDDSDLTSKSTFSMLGQIFSLQAGKSKSVVPVLTLPIGQ